MKASSFKTYLESVATLTPSQLGRLRKRLTSEHTERNSFLAIEEVLPHVCSDPKCGPGTVVRNGVQNGLQRVRCRKCGKTWNAASGTPLSRVRHKEKLDAFAGCMSRGLSIRKTAKEVGLSTDTVFRWRHRFLKNVVAHQPKSVKGVLEVDETYFRESQKGTSPVVGRERRKRGEKAPGPGRFHKDWVPVLVGRVRGQPLTTDKMLCHVTGAEVTAALRDVVKPGDTIICTDKGKAFKNLKRTLGVRTESVKGGRTRRGAKGTFHVQSANSYHERLKTWIQRQLRGVASKYLPHYLAWHQLRTWNKQGVPPSVFITSALGRQTINV